MGTFYAWDGALRFDAGRARVNLLLNRASPWLDVDSYLPYEGKVVLRNKAAREIWVRIPLWADSGRVTCQVGGKSVTPDWFGRYVRFEHVDAGKSVTIEFPVEERTELWTAPPNAEPPLRQLPDAGMVFHMKFRGNTLVELTPPLAPGSWLYQQRPEQFRAKEAPMKETTRYVTPFQLRW